MKIFSSVAQMKLAFLAAGQQVETAGYYVTGDGGQARYLVKANESVDNLGNHDLAGTTVAILQTIENANVKQFGAKGDGVTDDTAAFDAAETASNPALVFVPIASYEIPGTVTGNFYSFGVVTIVTGTVNAIFNVSSLASITAAGLVERATQAEVDAGADVSRYVTPETLTGFSTWVRGNFVGTLTGMNASVTGTFEYAVEVIDGTYSKVILWLDNILTGTSNQASMNLTGVPAAIRPTSVSYVVNTIVKDNAKDVSAQAIVFSSGTITFGVPDGDWQAGGTFNSAGFETSGVKGLQQGWLIQYIID